MAGETDLDFWVGEWDCTFGEGVWASNRISRTLGGRVILEDFRSKGEVGVADPLHPEGLYSGRLRRSCSRHSRLVGRPAPGSRTGIRPLLGRTGAGGLWSTRHVAATGAPTRFSMMVTTSRIRSRFAATASTRSPAFTCVCAFAGARFTRTRPSRQAAVAADLDG
jgi:hypothetical protein